MALYVITGVPGVGKTTVIKEVLKRNNNFKVVNFGDVLLDMAKKHGLATNLDDIRKIEHDKYVGIQKKAADEIVRIKGDILLTTHCSMKTPTGYFPGLPFDVIRILRPKAIVLIEANPKTILRQREKDIGFRERSDFGGDKEITEFQNVNRYYAAAYSTLASCNIVFVENEFGRAEKAAEKILEVLR